MRRNRIAILTPDSVLPNPREAPENGPLAVSREITVARAIEAYHNGIFPWPTDADSPTTWWSPDPRCVLFLDDYHESRSTKRLRRKGTYTISCNRAFQDVVSQCANRDETWITPELHDVFSNLHRLGFAHSVEVWRGDRLVGGIYGMAAGPVFSGESMFSAEDNTSKLALTALVDLLKKLDFALIDCQVVSMHLVTLGATLIRRADYLEILKTPHFGTARMEQWKVESEA